MKKIIRFFLNLLDRILAFRYRSLDYVEGYLSEVQDLGKQYETALEAPIYTTIRSFAGERESMAYWSWVRGMIIAPEYAFMLFTLRENTIREMVGQTDPTKVMQLSARLDTLQIIDRYLHTGVKAYEEKVQRDKATAEG